MGGGIYLSDPSLNYSHRVDRFTFGAAAARAAGEQGADAECGMGRRGEQIVAELHAFHYVVSVVPVRWRSPDRESRVSYQQAVASFAKPVANMMGRPGIFIRYEFDPMSLDILTSRAPVRMLVVRFLGIVGGIFTMSRVIYLLVDRMMMCLGWGRERVRKKGRKRHR